MRISANFDQIPKFRLSNRKQGFTEILNLIQHQINNKITIPAAHDAATFPLGRNVMRITMLKDAILKNNFRTKRIQ